jgi:site-specific recombinase XerD
MKSQCSDKAGFTCINHPLAAAVTAKAWRIFREVEAFVLSDKCTCLEDVRHWNKVEDNIISVVGFLETEMRRMDFSLGAMKYHRSFIRKVADFGRFRTFADFTYQNVVDFDTYLRQSMRSQPSLYKQHTTLRRYIKIAINRKLCSYDPYVDFHVRKGKGRNPIFLEEEEIDRIRKWIPVNERLAKVRDCFLFQTFTGMAYVDMAKFGRGDVVEVDGDRVIRSNRKKTEESFVSWFLPEAEEIAERYDYRLPVISNQK